MLGGFSDKRCSLERAKQIYPHELHLKKYLSKSVIAKWKQKMQVDNEERLKPNEKLERSREYSKALHKKQKERRKREESNGINQGKSVEQDSQLKSMEHLFGLYGVQTSGSYRNAARRKCYLPNLNCFPTVFKAANQWKRIKVDKEEDEKNFLPVIPDKTNEIRW